jgi:hypothetical protein
MLVPVEAFQEPAGGLRELHEQEPDQDGVDGIGDKMWAYSPKDKGCVRCDEAFQPILGLISFGRHQWFVLDSNVVIYKRPLDIVYQAAYNLVVSFLVL